MPVRAVVHGGEAALAAHPQLRRPGLRVPAVRPGPPALKIRAVHGRMGETLCFRRVPGRFCPNFVRARQCAAPAAGDALMSLGSG